MSTKKKDIKDQVKDHVKGISTLVIGYGVGQFMGAVMKDFKPDAKGIKKLFIKVGALALTGMVIKAATDYAEKEIDEVFDFMDELSEKLTTLEKEKTDVDQ